MQQEKQCVAELIHETSRDGLHVQSCSSGKTNSSAAPYTSPSSRLKQRPYRLRNGYFQDNPCRKGFRPAQAHTALFLDCRGEPLKVKITCQCGFFGSPSAFISLSCNGDIKPGTSISRNCSRQLAGALSG